MTTNSVTPESRKEKNEMGVMTVRELIAALKEMPLDAEVAIEVSAYYWEGDRISSSAIEDPHIDTASGKVVIGSVYAQP